jgi:hypothetical protein
VVALTGLRGAQFVDCAPTPGTVVDRNDLLSSDSQLVHKRAFAINNTVQIAEEGMVGGRNQAFLLNP